MQVFYNIRDEMAKNKEMKKNLEKFRAEKKKLEESDNLIKARQQNINCFILLFTFNVYKYFRQKLNTIESETFKVTQQAKSVVDIVMSTVKTKVNQASESDLAKKAGMYDIFLMNTVLKFLCHHV